jgi:hypothetical protein
MLPIAQSLDQSSERRMQCHLAICHVCGRSYDMRDLAQIINHENDHAIEPEPEGLAFSVAHNRCNIT